MRRTSSLQGNKRKTGLGLSIRKLEDTGAKSAENPWYEKHIPSQDIILLRQEIRKWSEVAPT